MSSRLKLAGICFAAALGLAACGGGGGTTAVMPPPTEPPPPPPVATVMIPDAMYLDEDNAPSAGSMTIAAGDSYTNNGVTFDCPAGGMACEVEVMDDGSVTSTGGEAMASLTADAMVQVAQAKKDAADEAARAAQEMKDRIIGKDRAIEAASNLATTTGTAGTLEEDDVSITRAAGGMARVRVNDATLTGYSVSDDPALPNGNWAGTHLTRSITGATQHLFVYTDIDPPTRIQFYNFDGDPDTPFLYSGGALDAATTPATTATVIPGLALAGGADGNFSANTADSSQFPAPQSAEEGSRTQQYANNTQIGGADAFSTPGNFNGAGGRYDCTGGTAEAPCSVEVAPNGSFTLVGTWVFVPELNATAWRQDPEFMSFGWWLQEPTAQTGVYTFQYYADGNAYQRPAGETLAAGSAIYNGRAAGKFVVQDIDNTGVTGGENGMFTAAASLTATFGATNSISGSISGFQTDNAKVDVSGWSVTLNRQTFAVTDTTDVTSTGNQLDPTAPGFNGATATMGDQTAHGNWSSQFFGQPTTADAYPLGVGGTFQADNENVSIGGAFGARR
ncbi:MAG: hypothetical protein OYG32_07495 [Rhodospirillaceae bacterium]|nr:hypothetical protein [Rhodospirillaceae bacterium]MDE0254624.1 hypothetical protein [Rhodospirillaceae bacterium]MDE0617850.1 hypothetical protein [Rhodospirillaceae bacterium]